MDFKAFFKKNESDLLIILTLCTFTPLYFYNLSGYSLVDFDEAWYGEIAKNILKTHNPLLLYFNGQPYLDHPPFGFVLMAISILILGANELAVRLPSALCGFLSLPVLYLIGKKLFNRSVGFYAALILTSSVWFVFRGRSGDLDTILLFFFLLSFYTGIKIKENVNLIYLFPFLLAALLLTKSLIGFTVIPPIIAYLLQQKAKVPLHKAANAVIIFIIITAPWFIKNYLQYKTEFLENLLTAGARSTSRQNINFLELNKSLTFVYLHEGIRKWYYPALFSVFISLIFVRKTKNLIPLYIWIGILFYGFLTNRKTEIWHLLPIYPPLAILSSFTIYKLFSVFKSPKIITVSTVGAIGLLSTFQIYQFRNEIKLFDHEISGSAYTAKSAKGYSEKLILDTDLFTPAVPVFYSDKEVSILKLQPAPQNTLKGIFQSQKRPFLLLSEKWKLDLDGISESDYQTLSAKEGHVLVWVQ